MKKNYSLILVLFLQIFAIKAQFNANIGFINVANGTGVIDPGPYPQITGLTISPFEAVGVSSQPSASGRFSFSGWDTGAINGSDDCNLFTGAFSALKYYEVKLHVQTGYKLLLYTIYFHMRRSSTGPRSFVVRSNQSNFSSNLTANSGTANAVTVLPGNEFFWLYDSASTASDQKVLYVVPFQAPCYENDSLVFRFYAWNSESTSGSFSIDNVTLTGHVKSIEDALDEISESENTIIYDEALGQLKLKNLQTVQWQVFNFEGKEVLLENSELVRLQHLNTGIYNVVVSDHEKRMMKKIMLR